MVFFRGDRNCVHELFHRDFMYTDFHKQKLIPKKYFKNSCQSKPDPAFDGKFVDSFVDNIKVNPLAPVLRANPDNQN
jgi:hypothetical protein